MLERLNQALDQDLRWEKKREIVEALVESIIVHSKNGEIDVDVTYRFDPVTNRTDIQGVTRLRTSGAPNRRSGAVYG